MIVGNNNSEQKSRCCKDIKRYVICLISLQQQYRKTQCLKEKKEGKRGRETRKMSAAELGGGSEKGGLRRKWGALVE